MYICTDVLTNFRHIRGPCVYVCTYIKACMYGPAYAWTSAISKHVTRLPFSLTFSLSLSVSLMHMCMSV